MLKRGILLILFYYTLSNSAFAQGILFNEAFPVAPDSDAWSFSIQNVSNGYVVYGVTVDSLGDSAPAIIKMDSNGNIIWQKSYYRMGYNFIPSATANELGITLPWGGEVGSINWQNDTSFSYAYCSLYRFDGNGDTIWTKNYNDSANIGLNQIKISRYNKYILYGEWLNSTYRGITLALIETDTLGNKIWTKTYHDDHERSRTPGGMDTCKDGGYILCAYEYDTIANLSKSGCVGGEIMVMKTDSSGKTQWIKYIADTLCDVTGYSIRTLKNGGYVICGFWDDSLTDQNQIPYCKLYMVKLNDTGSIVWSKQYGVSL